MKVKHILEESKASKKLVENNKPFDLVSEIKSDPNAKEYVAHNGKTCYNIGAPLNWYFLMCSKAGLNPKQKGDFYYTAKGKGYEFDWVEEDVILALDKKPVKEGYPEYDLPDTVVISINELDYDPEDGDVLDDAIGDYLSDRYGFCHYGFDYSTDAATGDITVTNIDWDVSESMKIVKESKETDKVVKDAKNVIKKLEGIGDASLEVEDVGALNKLKKSIDKVLEKDKKPTYVDKKLKEDYSAEELDSCKDGFGKELKVGDTIVGIDYYKEISVGEIVSITKEYGDTIMVNFKEVNDPRGYVSGLINTAVYKFETNFGYIYGYKDSKLHPTFTNSRSKISDALHSFSNWSTDMYGQGGEKVFKAFTKDGKLLFNELSESKESLKETKGFSGFVNTGSPFGQERYLITKEYDDEFEIVNMNNPNDRQRVKKTEFTIDESLPNEKKKKQGYFVKYNVGNTQKEADIFNKNTGAAESDAECSGESCGEGVAESVITKRINIREELNKLDQENYRDLLNMYESIIATSDFKKQLALDLSKGNVSRVVESLNREYRKQVRSIK